MHCTLKGRDENDWTTNRFKRRVLSRIDAFGAALTFLFIFQSFLPSAPHLLCLKVRPSSSVTDLPGRKARAAAHDPEKELSQALLSSIILEQPPGFS